MAHFEEVRKGRAMLIEDPNEIDLSASPDAFGKLELAIIDAGITLDPKKRQKLLNKKILTYLFYLSDVGFSSGEKFRDDFPNVKRENVTIVLLLKDMSVGGLDPPQSQKLFPPHELIEVSISARPLNEDRLNSRQRNRLAARRNKRWWQFWI